MPFKRAALTVTPGVVIVVKSMDPPWPAFSLNVTTTLLPAGVGTTTGAAVGAGVIWFWMVGDCVGCVVGWPVGESVMGTQYAELALLGGYQVVYP